MSLTFTGGAAASASTAQHAKGAEAAETAGMNLMETVDSQSIQEINEEIAIVGGTGLPSNAVAFGFNTNGDAVAVDAAGNETILESAVTMDAQLDATPQSSPTGDGQTLAATANASDDKGVLTGLVATLAGCGGSVIGYDAILSILEKRVSYWALVKFLGAKLDRDWPSAASLAPVEHWLHTWGGKKCEP